MPTLYDLTDAAYPQDNTLPVEQPYTGPNLGPLQRKIVPVTVEPDTVGNTSVLDRIKANLGMAGVEDKTGQSESPLIKRLFGLGGEERYQTWPERIVREGLSAPHDVLTSPVPSTSQSLIEPAMQTAALAGSGGIAGAEEGAAAALGSSPFLRPALKYEGKIYKAPMGGQHLDALPAHLADEFERQAMSGEDISNFNFGFMNHKGQFLNREAALDYGIKEGLIDPHAGQYGALTSTLLADSSKPGVALEGNPFEKEKK